MVMKRFLIVLFTILMVISPAYAITASLGSSRAVINFELSDKASENVLQRDLIVRNVNEFPIEVTLEGDDGFKGIATFPVNPVKLDPNTEKPIPFKVQLSQPGTIDGKINVYFRRDDGVEETPAVLRATYIVLASGEGQDVPLQELPEGNSTEPNPLGNLTDGDDEEAPRTLGSNESSNGSTVGLNIGGETITNPLSDDSGKTNWFLISFIVLIVIIIILGAVYILRQ